MQQTPQTDKICNHSRGTKHSLRASSLGALWRLLIENPRRAFSHYTQSTKHVTRITFARKKQQRLGSDRLGKGKIYNQHKQGKITNSSNPKNEKLICVQFNQERMCNQHQGALAKVEVNKRSQISQYSTVALKLITVDSR